MLVYELQKPQGERARLQALAYLRDPSRYASAISLYGRLSFAQWMESSYLITNEDTPEEPRVIAALDRARRPETELWMFAEWEVAEVDENAARAIVQQLIKTVKGLALPDSINPVFEQDAVAEADHSGLNRGEYAGHASNTNIVLCGAVHERGLPVFRALDLSNPALKHTEIPFLTYIFDNEYLNPCKPLPEGLRWGSIQAAHVSLIQSRTQIPRQASTLLGIPGIGVFGQFSDELIAWGFIGLDGSLTTLHVEPEYRGRGLAKTLTHKLLTEKMDGFFEGGAPRYGYGHVAHENEASRRLCESVGGKAAYSVHWLRVDLSRI